MIITMPHVSEENIKKLSKMVHEANRAFCQEIGDDSQKPWSEAPGYNHESAMVGIRAICENPTMSHEDSHDVWMKTKTDDGWVYGPTKDYDKKTHPSIVPYDKLSASEKYKDFLVRYIVLSYLDFIGDSPR